MGDENQYPVVTDILEVDDVEECRIAVDEFESQDFYDLSTDSKLEFNMHGLCLLHDKDEEGRTMRFGPHPFRGPAVLMGFIDDKLTGFHSYKAAHSAMHWIINQQDFWQGKYDGEQN